MECGEGDAMDECGDSSGIIASVNTEADARTLDPCQERGT